MTITDVIRDLGLSTIVPAQEDIVVQGGYVSDLLSDVMGRAEAGSVWVTVQSHQNIVAVAALADLAGIIIVNGVQPEAAVISKAREQGVAVYGTTGDAFNTVGKLYALGVMGRVKRDT